MFLTPRCPPFASALMLQVRFGDAIDKNQERVDDPIDATPALLFWLQWIAVPWWPVSNIAAQYFRSAHTFLDDVFLVCTYIGIALDALMLYTVSSFCRTQQYLLSSAAIVSCHV